MSDETLMETSLRQDRDDARRALERTVEDLDYEKRTYQALREAYDEMKADYADQLASSRSEIERLRGLLAEWEKFDGVRRAFTKRIADLIRALSNTEAMTEANSNAQDPLFDWLDAYDNPTAADSYWQALGASPAPLVPGAPDGAAQLNAGHYVGTEGSHPSAPKGPTGLDPEEICPTCCTRGRHASGCEASHPPVPVPAPRCPEWCGTDDWPGDEGSHEGVLLATWKDRRLGRREGFATEACLDAGRCLNPAIPATCTCGTPSPFLHDVACPQFTCLRCNGSHEIAIGNDPNGGPMGWRPCPDCSPPTPGTMEPGKERP